MTTFIGSHRLAVVGLAVVLACVACRGRGAARDATTVHCPSLPEPVSSTGAPDPRREPPALIRAALDEASDETYVLLQPALNSRLLLDEVTPELAEAYGRRWLRLATRPREWFIEHTAWESADDESDDDGPMRHLVGDASQLSGASVRLAIAEALVEGRIAREARPDAIAVAAWGGVPVADAIRNSAVRWSVLESRALAADGLLLPLSAPSDAAVPDDEEEAWAWLLDDPLRPVSRLSTDVRRRFVTRLSGAIDPAPLTPAEASRVLAELAAATDGTDAAIAILRGVRWPIDLTQLPTTLAREVVGTVPHVPLDSAQRAQLFGDANWWRSASRDVETRGSLGAINALTRWRVSDAAVVLRECARKNGSFYPSDAATVALASMGDARALEWFDQMLARGPRERVWQLLQQPTPYAATSEMIDTLLKHTVDGRREALDVVELMRCWFGAQVDARCDGAYDRAAAVVAWRDWWTANGSHWCWDPWSARFWPAESWREDLRSCGRRRSR